jgi:hypothetical protein
MIMQGTKPRLEEVSIYSTGSDVFALVHPPGMDVVSYLSRIAGMRPEAFSFLGTYDSGLDREAIAKRIPLSFNGSEIRRQSSDDGLVVYRVADVARNEISDILFRRLAN